MSSGTFSACIRGHERWERVPGPEVGAQLRTGSAPGSPHGSRVLLSWTPAAPAPEELPMRKEPLLPQRGGGRKPSRAASPGARCPPRPRQVTGTDLRNLPFEVTLIHSPVVRVSNQRHEKAKKTCEKIRTLGRGFPEQLSAPPGVGAGRGAGALRPPRARARRPLWPPPDIRSSSLRVSQYVYATRTALTSRVPFPHYF